MMKKTNILTIFLLLIIISCNRTNVTKTDKNQENRNKIINVQEKVTDIHHDLVLGNSVLNIIDNLLLVTDLKSTNKGIHLFDKNTFNYITSTGIIGRGPGEISRYGTIGINKNKNTFWISDYGKLLMWKFPIDSILKNDHFKPSEKVNLNKNLMIARYEFLNDSIVLGKAVHPLNHYEYIETMARFNINANKIKRFGYNHPKAVGKKSRSYFKLSVSNEFYVNCYIYCDLMTICDLNGNLKYNVYGPDWLENNKNKKDYFAGVDIIDKYIIASYLGEEGIIINQYKRPQGNLPSKLLVFDIKGNYIKTIETGHKFQFFCIDEENNRVIAYFVDRENPLGYFNLNLD